MAERVYDVMSAGCGSRVYICIKRERFYGTIESQRWNRGKGRSTIFSTIQLDDGRRLEYYRPKEITIVEAAKVHLDYDTGRNWLVRRERFKPETFVGSIHRRQKHDGYDDRGRDVWVEVGYEIVRKTPDGDNSKRVYEGPYPLFKDAIAALLTEKTDAGPADHAQVAAAV